MLHPLPGMALVLVTLLAMLAVLQAVARRAQLHPELLRKLVHVGMGLVALGFPWLFAQRWPVVVMAAVAAGLLLAVRLHGPLRERLGTVLHGVERTSLGEIYYPLAVGVLFVLSFGQPLLYVVPMLMLTLADALAAVIGVRYGSIHYQTSDGRKSAEGSAAFFIVAFFSVHVPLLLFSDVGRAESLLIGVILGLLVMLLESIAWRGLDNLFIPLGGFVLLSTYQGLSADALLWRLLATVVLVSFTLAWRRRTSLDDSALVAAALFGYVALMVGGWLWLIAPLMLFILHTLAWPRGQSGRYHTSQAVLCTTLAGLVWLLLFASVGEPAMLYPYSVAFAAHMAIIGASRLAWQPTLANKPARLAGYVAGAWVLVAAPLVVLMMWPTMRSADEVVKASGGARPPVLEFALLSFVAVAGPAGAFYRLIPALYLPTVRANAIDFTGATLGLLASLITAVAFL